MANLNRHLTFGPVVDGLLDRLYEQHAGQDAALGEYFSARAAEGSLDWNSFDERTNAYADYFEFVRDPGNRLRTLTLPFPGFLEFTVRV